MVKQKQTRIPDPREDSRIGPRSLKDKNSPEYAWQTLALLRTFFQSKQASIQQFEKVLAEAEADRIFEKIPEDKPYGSMEALLCAELGVDGKEQAKLNKSQQMAGDDGVEAMPAHGELGNGRKSRGANSTSTRGSTHAATIIRRLKRDHDNIAKALARGEYPSARAAGIAAGIVPNPTPLEKILKLLPKLSLKDRQELLRRLKE